MAEAEQTDLTALTVQLLSAYVANNSVPSNELADLIEKTRGALAGTPAKDAAPDVEFTPAVSVRKSQASRDHLLSLIDGKPYKTLKRHLSGHGLTPAEYRSRYNLPADYPMVAASYSEQRREVAHRLGLGRRARVSKVEETASPSAPSAAAPSKAPSKLRAKRGPVVVASATGPVSATAPTKAEPLAKVKATRKTRVAKPAAKATAPGSVGAASTAIGTEGPAKAPRKARVKAAPSAGTKPARAISSTAKPKQTRAVDKASPDGKPAARRGRKPKQDSKAAAAKAPSAS